MTPSSVCSELSSLSDTWSIDEHGGLGQLSQEGSTVVYKGDKNEAAGDGDVLEEQVLIIVT